MGNACVLKPGEEASQTSLMVGELATQAGFPRGVFNIVTGLGEEAGEGLINHSGVHHLSFTGSTEVGALVQQAAAKNAAPVTLELGGKSPQVVLPMQIWTRLCLFLLTQAFKIADKLVLLQVEFWWNSRFMKI